MKGENVLGIIQRLEFLDCVIKENFRLYPPTPAIARRMEENVVIDRQTIYEGTNVAIWGLHRNEEYWENSLTFNPYCFMGMTFSNEIPSVTYFFSADPRNCVGEI